MRAQGVYSLGQPENSSIYSFNMYFLSVTFCQTQRIPHGGVRKTEKHCPCSVIIYMLVGARLIIYK